jgi:hypothetical protein
MKLAPLAFAVVILATGCSDAGKSRVAIVRGKVTYKGKAVPHGTLTFIPDSGPPATGEIQPDGAYSLTTYAPGDGAVIGHHKVLIVAMQDNAGRLPEERLPLPPPIIPAKYTSPATTPLTADVLEHENTIDFELK